MHQALQGLADGRKPPFLEGFLLCLAQCCTVLRSPWCQSGVRWGSLAALTCPFLPSYEATVVKNPKVAALARPSLLLVALESSPPSYAAWWTAGWSRLR